MLEAKANILRLTQSIPLTDDERAAADGDLTTIGRLCARLADVPTPTGQTPRQPGAVIPLMSVAAPRETPSA